MSRFQICAADAEKKRTALRAVFSNRASRGFNRWVYSNSFGAKDFEKLFSSLIFVHLQDTTKILCTCIASWNYFTVYYLKQEPGILRWEPCSQRTRMCKSGVWKQEYVDRDHKRRSHSTWCPYWWCRHCMCQPAGTLHFSCTPSGSISRHLCGHPATLPQVARDTDKGTTCLS